MDYKEIIKERIKILPESLRAFVLDENWRRDMEKVGRQFNLNEERYASLENEVFLALLCFEPRVDLAENIKRELSIDSNMAGWIVEDVNKNIFSKVTDEINSMWQMMAQKMKAEVEKPQTPEAQQKTAQSGVGSVPRSESGGVGQSFEQIILNQAKAMQPAREAGGSSQQQIVSSKVPENIPTEQEKTRVTLPNHSNSQDPYREPLT